MGSTADGSKRDGLSRRDFLNRSVLVGGGTLFVLTVPGCLGAAPKPRAIAAEENAAAPTFDLKLGEAPELQNIGGVRRIREGTFDFFLVRTGEEDVIALENVCTHQGCKTRFDEATREFACPCHGSRFDLNGKPVAGPAPSPLRRFPVVVESGMIRVTLQA